jgi:hypothetical protein
MEKHKIITWADAAYEVLKKKMTPMNYRDITKKAIKIKGVFSGKTPAQTVRVLLASDPRFKKTDSGTYGLVEWV